MLHVLVYWLHTPGRSLDDASVWYWIIDIETQTNLLCGVDRVNLSGLGPVVRESKWYEWIANSVFLHAKYSRLSIDLLFYDPPILPYCYVLWGSNRSQISSYKLHDCGNQNWVESYIPYINSLLFSVILVSKEQNEEFCSRCQTIFPNDWADRRHRKQRIVTWVPRVRNIWLRPIKLLKLIHFLKALYTKSIERL